MNKIPKEKIIDYVFKWMKTGLIPKVDDNNIIDRCAVHLQMTGDAVIDYAIKHPGRDISVIASEILVFIRDITVKHSVKLDCAKLVNDILGMSVDINDFYENGRSVNKSVSDYAVARFWLKELIEPQLDIENYVVNW